MLIYNIIIFVVAFLLYVDYVYHDNNIKLKYGTHYIYLGNTFLYLSLIVIISFSGFRFEIGYDYQKYLAGYLFDSELREWEPFFNFVVRLLRQINFGFELQAVFLVFSALSMIIVYKALRSLTPHYRLGIFFYLLIPSLYLNTFSILRQGIALAILLYGLQYITIKVDYKKYAVFVFIAFMFHYSSIFVAIIYAFGGHFFQRTYSWITYLFMILGSFFLSFAHIGKIILMNMPGHFSKYADYEMSTSSLKLLIVNMFFLFFMYQKDKFIKSRLDHYIFNSIFIGLLIFNIFSDFVFVSRLAQYFLAVEIILVPFYLYSIKDSFTRTGMLVLFVIYYLFNFNYALYRDKQFKIEHPEMTTLVPYKNYFFEEKKLYRTEILDAWYDFIIRETSNEEGNEE